MLFARVASHGQDLGGPEPCVVKRYPSAENGELVRSVRSSRHHTKVCATFGNRLVDHLAVVVKDNVVGGEYVESTPGSTETRYIVRRPLQQNELMQVVAGQHLTVELLIEGHGVAAGRLGVLQRQ